jgi:hypothetical protein
MEAGLLSQYFAGVGVKTVTGTEVDPTVSRGHEFQGVDSFRAFLGTPSDRISVPVKYVWLSDEEPPFVLPLAGTWYDSRRGKGHRGPEYRLYYPAAAEEVVYRARHGDTLFLCMGKDDSLLALLCAAGSSIEQQLLWLRSSRVPMSGSTGCSGYSRPGCRRPASSRRSLATLSRQIPGPTPIRRSSPGWTWRSGFS